MIQCGRRSTCRARSPGPSPLSGCGSTSRARRRISMRITMLLPKDGTKVINGGPAACRGTQALPRKAELVQLKHLDHAPPSLSLHTSKLQLPLFFLCCCLVRALFNCYASFAKYKYKQSTYPIVCWSSPTYLIVSYYVYVVPYGPTSERSLKRNIDHVRRSGNEFDVSRLTKAQDYRIFVSTWNVGGQCPSRGLNLDD
ncbi:unnamed protein product [Triticum turgidum subsp. durum]|uniref:Uncharacterized protein n=1 Tax=Triticum turgidum subsp. durum TaxID=4567 RepID=A0A9R0Y0Y5_TRITD|nr:unnamed protein product [Triticum turgidum subsp. durum]